MRAPILWIVLFLGPHSTAWAQEAPAAAQEQASEKAQDSVPILTKEVCGQFAAVLQAVLAEATGLTSEPDDADPTGEMGDPLRALVDSIPKDRLDTIAQAHGFAHGEAWHDVGRKIIAVQAIVSIMGDSGVSKDELDVDVSGVFPNE